MYIKTLTIQGFKSYRDQTQIEPFSPKHNVVVGRNGSGKSNFFAAIRFVLSDAYTSMSREERQALLHEGVSTTTTLSAFVEIIFDNTSNRFPTGRDTVTIRRTIGLKKDEYSLDKKSVSKADVMNLLESAGFSRANPYYIVPQGRITSLTNAKDHERLALLKEVAGTHVYETRRAESLGIMAATSAKRAKVGELLEYIKGRLEELEEEKEELGEWMEGDKERRCLEYALYVRELEDVGAALEEVEEERRGEVHAGNLRREGWERREMDMKNLEKEISETKSTLTTLTLTRQGHTSELSDLHRTRTQLTCIITDLQASPSNNPSLLADLESDLAAIDEAIEDKEGELGEVKPLWEDVRRREVEERRELVGVEGRLGELFDKQGRVAQFRTKAERDAFLTSTISSLTSFQNTTKSSLTALQSTLANTRQALVDVEERIKGKEDEGGDARVRGREVGEGIKAMRERLGEVEERRREGWREDTRLESLVGREKEELRGVERELGGMMDKDTGMGLKAIDRIKERYGLDGVYGPLYRLFEIPDPKFNIAVELTAGNSLFHVVVDTDETASKVLDIMMKEKTGRVTFMPLNRLKPKNPPLPNASDAIPLLSKLQYDPSLTKAFQQVFGKTCVCRDLTIAAAYVKSHGINTITLDGDKVDRKGALTGGFHDVRRSRIEAIKNVAVWKKKFEEDERRLKEVKEVVLGCDQEIAKITGEIAVATNRMNAAKEAREAAVREVGVLEKERERLRERIGRLEGEVEEMEGELRGVEGRLDGLRRELSSPMTSGLTQEEEGEIETLQKEVEGRQKRLVEIGKEKAELGTRKSLIEIELGENLKKRRDELRDKIQSFGDADTGDASSVGDLEARTRELKNLNSSIDSLTKRTADLDKEVEKLNARHQELRAQLEEVQTQQNEDSRGISKQQKNTERYLAKRAMLTSRKEDCNRNIRDLGVLPEEAFEKYTNERAEKIAKKLRQVNDGLKKFAHVNKKAFEQYSNFTKQRDQLLKRREELDTSAESIEELIQVLDQRKDEAIERTFKQVASNFEEVFEKLVPAGRGKLIIQRRVDRDEDDDEEEDTQQNSVDNYTGVSIKVSFNSKVDEGLRIQQLSGGQKSLVALATVFAIQKCDPAPFYLFDEIDANLDAQYRTAVASMIQSLSSTAQFITTTFRPEMLVTADKFYGVLFNAQKVSSIRSIKREEAMEFVEQEAQAQ